jgi:hypothetical protein
MCWFKDDVLEFLINAMSIDKGMSKAKSEVQMLRERHKSTTGQT